MGYRSEVCIALTDAAARLLRTIEEHLPENSDLRSLLRDSEGDYRDTPPPHEFKELASYESKLYWGGLKWYEGFKEVSDLIGFLENICPTNYRFVRVGEDLDDVEEHGEFYDSEVYVHRSISW